MNDDGALLRRYAEEADQAAFAELVQRHLPLVYNAALRQLAGAVHRSEEVTQAVFTDLARKAASIARRTDIAGWLYTSTHFAAAKLKRAEQRRQQREQEAHTMDELSTPAGDADWAQLRPVLDELLNELPETDRRLILQRYFQGRRHADIAAQFATSEPAVRMRLDRALEKLRRLLARREITSTTTALALALANQPAVAVPAGLAATIANTAMASTAAGTTSLTALLQLMSTSKTVAATLGIIAAITIGVATYETRARLVSIDSLASAKAAVAQVTITTRDLQNQAAAADQSVTALTADLANAGKPSAPTPAPRPPDIASASKAFFTAHPEAREFLDERERANIAAKLMPIYRLMNLNGAEQRQIEDLAIAGQSGVTRFEVDGQLLELRREASIAPADRDRQLIALLGPERTAQFQDLGRLTPTFDFTSRLASSLYRTEPLTAAQAQQVMQIFADASPVARGANPNAPAGIDWSAISAAAARVLSPSQLAGLTALQRNFEYQQATRKLSEPPRNPAATR